MDGSRIRRRGIPERQSDTHINELWEEYDDAELILLDGNRLVIAGFMLVGMFVLLLDLVNSE